MKEIKKYHKIGIVILGAIIVLGVLVGYNSHIRKVAIEELNQLPQAVQGMTDEEVEDFLDVYRIKEEVEEEIEEQEEEVATIDFEEIQSFNSDVYAWISIPGTNIDYPVLQHEFDDSYYLNYNLDGSHGYPGCIYTERINSKDFQDYNTVLYGHNMKEGTMFAELHEFKNGNFFLENNTIYIYTPEETLEYRIFAAYVYDDRHILYNFDFSTESGYASYIDSIYIRRGLNDNIDETVEVTSEQKIITLATCIGDMPENRLLVQAVLIEEAILEEAILEEDVVS
ncbi:MAG: class B sortase [Eubacteriales bacterium]